MIRTVFDMKTSAYNSEKIFISIAPIVQKRNVYAFNIKNVKHGPRALKLVCIREDLFNRIELCDTFAFLKHLQYSSEL